MADKTAIEWTEATWNPITGCSVVSPGCTNCYAMRLAGTRLKNHPTRSGLTVETKAGPVWNGQLRFNERMSTDPLRWKRPRMIFVCAHGDLFHEDVPEAWIDQVFAVMALCPQHTFQVLTKRPERMRAYLTDCRRQLGRQHELRKAIVELANNREAPGVTEAWIRVSGAEGKWRPLPNVWLGVSVEDQRRAEERIPLLLDTPSALRWISAEPLLGPVSIIDAVWAGDEPATANLYAAIDWLVAGGESGPGARPMHPDWIRSLRNQCADASVPFLFKQWGEWIDADQAFDCIERGPSQVVVDGKPWKPARPLNFSDAAQLAKLNGDRWEHHSDGSTLYRRGKKRAGRTLDGTIHDSFPEVS